MAFENLMTFNNTETFIVLDFSLYNYRINNPFVDTISFRVNGYGNVISLEARSNYVLNSGIYDLKTGNNSFQTITPAANLWLQRELKNTAPTQPGAFTQPTGELEIGDTRTISWGASSDAEGNLRGYILEWSRNGGAYEKYLEDNTTTYTVPIPAVSTLKFRVKAFDENLLESLYRESPTYTVTKQKYYWSKYNVSAGARGSLIQTGIVAVEDAYPIDGIHTDGFWYVRGSRVNQSIAPTGTFTAPTPATTLKPNQGVSVAFAASAATNISLYELEYRYNSGLWTTVGTNNASLSRSFTPTTDKTLTTIQFRVRAKNTSNVYSDYVYSETFPIEHNAKPTITLTTADNPSLTENANLVLAGQAVDTDNGNVLTVYYQINTGTTTAIATGISNGTTPLTYSKTLQYRQGTLYDGTTSVFANLVGNQTYTLKVWAEDNQGGKSDVQTRSFTVVPNRAPIVTVAAITTATDKINNDSITVNGTVTDPDNQTVVVKYKINSGALVQAYSGAGGNYTFNFKLASLNDGDNIVEIQASDVYGLTTTIKRKFNKTKNKKELLESVVRYRGILPAAGITGVVAWFEREKGDLTLTPSLSLTTTGQNESFTNMNLSNTGPVTDTITEDQYQLSVDEPKTGMTLKVNLIRTATTSDKGIKKITGALQ